MVNAVGGHETLNISNILRAQYSSGKVALPLDGGVYARFRHIQGIPAVGDGGGYSISKLRTIDVLVDRLVRLRGREVEAPQPRTDSEAGDAIIELAKQLHDELASTAMSAGTFASGVSEPGLLFDLVA